MAPVDPNTKPNPMVAAILTFCCFCIPGYLMCGQTMKGVMVFVMSIIASVVTFFVGGLGGMVIGVFALLDVLEVGKALQAGEPVDENEYKFELLYKCMKFIHKDAVYNGPSGGAAA